MKCIGLITARGGSKGIPRKNVILAGGRPLIAWTIAAAQSSTRLQRTIVSTDCTEIATVARAHGADVPFLRPSELARDDTPHTEVIKHAVDWLAAHGELPDYIILLQPTSPMRTGSDIDAAIGLMQPKAIECVVSIVRSPVHPYWMKKRTEDGYLTDFALWPEMAAYARRQTLPPAYALNGAIYVIDVEHFKRTGTYLSPKTVGYEMPPERSFDIDTMLDLKIVDALLTSSP